MFERCDDNARLVVEVALEEARRRRHNWLGTEHLLVALARRRDLLPDDVAHLLPDDEGVVSALATAAGRGRPDTELLKAVGVDLDEVRSAVRRTFGDEAVQRLRRPVHQPWQPWRRPSRRCTSVLVGEISVSPRVKQSLERGLLHAEWRQVSTVDPLALLLGMVGVEGAPSNRLLRDLGVEPEELRRVAVRHVS